MRESDMMLCRVGNIPSTGSVNYIPERVQAMSRYQQVATTFPNT
jgi:hypothetical protein